MSHQSDPRQGFTFPINDKVVHFCEYVFLQFLAARTFCYGRQGAQWKMWFRLSIVYCFLFACVDEIHQAFIPARICSLFDYISDLAGIALCAFLIFRETQRSKKSREAMYHETV